MPFPVSGGDIRTTDVTFAPKRVRAVLYPSDRRSVGGLRGAPRCPSRARRWRACRASPAFRQVRGPPAPASPAGCLPCAASSSRLGARCASSGGGDLGSDEPLRAPRLRCLPTPSTGSRERLWASGRLRPSRLRVWPPCLPRRSPQGSVDLGMPRVVGPRCSPVTPPWEGACPCGPAPVLCLASPRGGALGLRSPVHRRSPVMSLGSPLGQGRARCAKCWMTLLVLSRAVLPCRSPPREGTPCRRLESVSRNLFGTSKTTREE
jgi:hypothetical protein